MTTKKANNQETLDLQLEDATTIKKEPKKKATKASSATVTKEEKKAAPQKKAAPKTTTSKTEGVKPTKKATTKKAKEPMEDKPASKKATTTKATKSKTAKDVETKEVKSVTESKPTAKKTTTAKKATTKTKATKTEAAKVEKEPTKDKTPTVKQETSKPKKAKPTTKKEDVKEEGKETQTVVDAQPTDKETPNTPIVENITRNKLFFVSDMDEEAVYLHEMSLQGYHFVSKKGMKYTFQQGEPKNYFYHLGYYEKDKRDGDRYLDNYSAAGWDNIYHEKAEFDGVWNYFRIEMPTGAQEPNIFSDRVSRLALYKRLLSSWRTLLAVDIICFFFTVFIFAFLSSHQMSMTGIYLGLCAVLAIIIILIFVIYLRAYLKISRKQKELEGI